MDHSLLDCHWVFSGPLEHLLVHFGDFGGVHGPQAALSLVGTAHRGFLDLLKTLVQRKIMSDRVLPAVWRRLEVGEVFAEKIKIKRRHFHLPNRYFSSIMCKIHRNDGVQVGKCHDKVHYEVARN